VTDAAQSLLDDTITAFQRSYEVTQNRYKAGVAARVDVVQSETQLLGAQANAIDLRVSRAQLEHAIAVLTGKPPANVTVEKVPFKVHIPEIPPGLPSTLLERRPDVAAAERRMAQANARIGVAQAAYFPALTLSGSGGFASTSVATLFDPASRFWSLGANLAGTLLDFGGRAAAVDTARAQYDESVAAYRQAVLVAFQEVEDNLSASRWYAEETKVQEDATRAARESVLLTGNQYRAGTVSLLNLIVVQAAQLNAERDMMTLLGRRLTAQVALIRAIGGSW
jgi:NodT family efflux transporter outer membrane factor (OMF) lipoprotein